MMNFSHNLLFKEPFYTNEMSNGLKINLMPRKQFHETIGMITVRYGSVDIYSSDNHTIYPYGIAHFLEHKLFEKKNYDISSLFLKYGADSNAFTTFTRTSYYFSTYDHVSECLDILLDLIQNPYFNPDSILKEKKIINQEIQMYKDDPDDQLFSGIIRNLYPKTSLQYDIVGSYDSIKKIDINLMYKCYYEFYRPANINIFVIGNFNYKLISNILFQRQNLFSSDLGHENQSISSRNHEFNTNKVLRYNSKLMNTGYQRLGIGIRGNKIFYDFNNRLKYRIELEFLLELLFGEISQNYQRLYDLDLIDDSFDYGVQYEEYFYFIWISLITKDAYNIGNEILYILRNAKNILEKEKALFDILKKDFLGRYINKMNFNDEIINQFDIWIYGSTTIFDVLSVIDRIKFNDLILLVDDLFREDSITRFIIFPKKKV